MLLAGETAEEVLMRGIAAEVRREQLGAAGVRPWTDSDDPLFESGAGDF
jgi:hypothetical protein